MRLALLAVATAMLACSGGDGPPRAPLNLECECAEGRYPCTAIECGAVQCLRSGPMARPLCGIRCGSDLVCPSGAGCDSFTASCAWTCKDDEDCSVPEVAHCSLDGFCEE